MAIKCIKWVSTTCLPCASKLPANVVLCVTPAKVAPHACITLQGGVQEGAPFQWHTIEAQVTDVQSQCCNGTSLNTYNFCYDDSLIQDKVTLFGTDILGVICKDCLTTWVEDVNGNDVRLFAPPEELSPNPPIQLITEHGCIYELPYERVYDFGTVTTTDATPVNIPFFPPFWEISVIFKLSIIARCTGGSAGVVGDTGTWVYWVGVKAVSGIISIVGTPSPLLVAKDVISWDVQPAVITNLFGFILTGAANTNISWNIHLSGHTFQLP